MQKPRHSSKTLLSAIVFLLILISLVAFAAVPAIAGAGKPDRLQDLRTRVQQAGSYRYTADIQQAIIPLASSQTIGQSDQRLAWHMEGDVALPDHASVRMQLAGNGAPSVTIVQDGTRTFVLQNGKLKEAANPTGPATPTSDYLAYLNAADNLQEVTGEEAAGSPEGYQHYQFSFNGPRFAEYMRQVLQEQMADKLPLGTQVAAPEAVAQMTGSGELWLDSSGLPRRQVLDLTIPRVGEYYQVKLHIIVDFQDFGKVESVPTAVQSADGSWGVKDAPVQRPSPASSLFSRGIQLPPSTLVLAVFSIFVALIVVYYRRFPRRVYAAIALLVVITLVVEPVFQYLQAVDFQEQQAKAAAATDTMVAGLLGQGNGLETETAAHETAPSAQPVLLASGSQIPSSPSGMCGDGDVNLDSDQDNLNDAAEYCLGTDPYTADSDRDGIADGVEVQGFDYGGKHWPLDPLSPDSNNDGLPDIAAIPAPTGNAPSIDIDSDEIPNVWDTDLDDDGIPNGLDLSPYSRSGYAASASISTQGSGFNGYEYIELQVQPQNSAHLHYSLTALDWPYDEQGQIQDLDNSTDDLRLIPMLQVLANAAPQDELASNYGITVLNNPGNTSFPYKLLLSLSPVSDGTQIYAFYTKVVYPPALVSSIQWSNIKLVWMVQGKLDQKHGRYWVDTTESPVATYEEPSFRIEGMQVTKSRDYSATIIGTPSSPDDDRQLYNLIFGLSSSFLNNQHPTLPEVYDRFTNINTDPLLKWGVTDNVAFDLQTVPYGHPDEAVAGLSQRVANFLNNNSYPTASSPSLIIATESSAGSFNMDESGLYEPGNAFTVNLANIDLMTQRGLKRQTYAYQGNGWQALGMNETLAVVNLRDVSADLITLRTLYPELTALALQKVIDYFYGVWNLGQITVTAINENPIVPSSASDQEVYDQVSQSGGGLPSYLVHVAHLGLPGHGLALGSSQQATWQYFRSEPNAYKYGTLVHQIGVYVGTSDTTSNLLVNGLKKGIPTALAIRTVFQAAAWAQTATGSFTKMMKLGDRTLGVVGAVIAVGLIWLQFGLTTDFSDPLAVKQAVAYAVVATAFTIALFIISLNPIGAIFVAVFSLLDLILFFATSGGFSLSDTIIKGITEFFYSVDILTEFGSADFVNFNAEPADTSQGILAGSRFNINDLFKGTIKVTGDGDNGDLNRSRINGWYEGSSSYATVVSQSGSSSCYNRNGTKYCSNPVGLEYQLNQAGRNLALRLNPRVHVEVRYEECTLLGLVCWSSSKTTEMPQDLPAENQWQADTLYIDALPATLDALWSWSEMTNPDRDGDGLTDSQEAALGTSATNWDTDGDGLSDWYEVGNQGALGTNPLIADSDNDGLADKIELQLGTKINQVDSDGDGQPDAQEVFHQTSSGTWEGGWQVSLPGITNPVTVFSDPRAADNDGDGLNDTAEKFNNASPSAYNGAPRLSLQASPLATAPDGTTAAFVLPGDTVVMTLTLESVGVQPITSTLELCLPEFFTSLEGGDLHGDRIPTRQPAVGCNGFQWSFAGGDTLQLWESVHTVVTATIDSSLSASTQGEAIARLPYSSGTPGSQEINSRVRAVVDADTPAAALLAPTEGELLGGGTTTYVVGGTAHDASTWVTAVDVDLPGMGTVRAEGTELWSAAWTLPADGVYSLQATALDYLGHSGSTPAISVMVDNTAPAVDFPLVDNSLVNGISSGDVISVTFSGSASDNLSGLARVQVSWDDQPWQEVWQDDGSHPLSVVWSAIRQLPDAASAQGKHAMAVRAYDRAGNLSAVESHTLIVDVVPPTSDLTNRAYLASPPEVPLGQSVTFKGIANDAGNVPLPSRPATLEGTLDGLSDATIWLGLSSAAENDGGVNVAWIGDFNGDRLADAAIGLPGAANGQGRLVVVYGSAGGWPTPTDLSMLADSPTSFTGAAGTGLGASFAAAGDVNGDGLSDLLVGDPANNRAFLVFGRPQPVGKDMLLDGSQGASWIEIVPPASRTMGDLVASAGDVNGDGCTDLLIGAGGAPNELYLLLGHGGPWDTTTDLGMVSAAQVVVGAGSFSALGMGDMDGDQLDEFAVSAGSTVYIFSGSGALSAYLNTPLALSDAAASFSSADSMPALAAPGDVNGDGLADFIYSNSSSPKLVFGDGSKAWGALDLAGISPALSGFLAAPGDINADGLGDLLIGNAGGDASLILGSSSLVPDGSLPAIQAILTGVHAAASTLYAAGADLNSDGSSDLLLVPDAATAAAQGMFRASFESLPAVDSGQLPSGSQSSTSKSSTQRSSILEVGTSRYVDADGGCSSAPCYTTIQAAIDASSDGDQITVLPGVYAPFIVDSVNNLQISGVNPDAVFVEGAQAARAVSIRYATGVKVSDMTIRHATHIVELNHAGMNGYATPADQISLDRLVMYGWDRAISMDRLSTVVVSRSTLVALDGADQTFEVTGSGDPAFASSWTTPSSDGRAVTNTGGGVAAGGSKLYIRPGGGSQNFYSHDLAANTWQTLPSSPSPATADSVIASGPDGNIYTVNSNDWANWGTGVNGQVNAVASDASGNAYAGGSFTTAGGLAVNYIAQWTGSAWQALGTGVGGTTPSVKAIAVYGNKVYVGGHFTTAGGVAVKNIAYWDGTWHDVGGGLSSASPSTDIVNAITIDASGNVYAAGSFTTAGGGVTANYLARWNGTAWQAVNNGLNGTIYSLHLNSGYLYAGGDFTNNIARWNGSAWDAYAAGPGGRVEAIAFIDNGATNDFFAGGTFGLKKWNTSTGAWDVLAYYGVNGAVHALQAFGDLDLYIGGDFTIAGNQPNPYLVRWHNGSLGWDLSWNGTSGNLNGSVYSLAVDPQGNGLLVGGNFTSGGSLTVNRVTRMTNAYRYNITSGGWSPLPPVTTLLSSGKIYPGAALTAVDGDHLYLASGGAENRTYWFSISANSWLEIGAVAGFGVGGAWQTANGNLYLLKGGSTTTLCKYSFIYYNLDCSLASAPYPVAAGGALAFDGVDWLYALAGGNGRQFMRYRISGNYWETLGDGSSLTPGDQDMPTAVNAGGSLVRIGHYLYGVPGGGAAQVMKYGPIQAAPRKLTFNSVAIVSPETTASFTWINLDLSRKPDDFDIGGSSNQFVGGAGTTFTPSLSQMPEECTTTMSTDVPKVYDWFAPQLSSQLTIPQFGYIDDLNIVGLNINTLPAETNISLQSPDGTWLQPVNGYCGNFPATSSYFNLDDSASSSVDSCGQGPMSGGTYRPDNQPLSGFNRKQMAGAWTIRVERIYGDWGHLEINGWGLQACAGNSTLTYDQARFLNPQHNLYRVGTGSVLNAGYHTWRADAVVAPSGEEFTSIQAAINSGANRVLVEPGLYQEAFYLLSGVQVLGTDAEYSVVQFPAGSSAPAIATLEGVTDAQINRLTLLGDGSAMGALVKSSAQFAKLQRDIIRNTTTAISVSGSGATLEVANNTLVENTNGMQALNCAGVDVRNTVFAFNTGVGLSYAACAVTKLHTYNDYWNNGTDLSPAEPGAGELFLDPLFADPLTHDYHTGDVSPLIDAGDPGDQAPPGAGQRVDIGYIEQGRAAVYADQSYCEDCLNDGLTWSVDAFDTIQAALNAAGDLVRLFTGLNFGEFQVSVGVGEGIYTELLSVPSHIRLVGSGADKTTIDAANTGSPVTFNNVTGSEISGFTIKGGKSVAGGGWDLQTAVTNAKYDAPISLAMDSSGLPHLSYYQRTYPYTLWYAWNDGAAWHTEPVSNVQTTGYADVSLALDSHDRPHISFGGSSLTHAWRDAIGTWYLETVPGSEAAGATSIVIDPSDHPHIAYSSYSSMKYAYWTGAAWIVQTADSSPAYGRGEPSLQLDSAGDPHISYLSETSGYSYFLSYAEWNGSAWNAQTVSSGGTYGCGEYNSLALDSSGNPYISYFDKSNYALKMAHWNGSAWSLQTIDAGSSTYVGLYTSISLDSNSNPIISYVGTNALRLAMWNGASWSIQTIDGSGRPYSTSLALDPFGDARIAYYVDDGSGSIRYASPGGISGSAGVTVSGSSNSILITRNLIRDNPIGVAFKDRSTGQMTFNTVVNHIGAGILADGTAAWAEVRNNILDLNGIGLLTYQNGRFFNDYNLIHSTTHDYWDRSNSGLEQGLNEILGQLAGFDGSSNYYLTPSSPAVDAADPLAAAPVGGGLIADLGYHELVAAPLALFLGKEDVSSVTGNSGVGSVEFGVVRVTDSSQPITDTLPLDWTPANLLTPGLADSYWQAVYTPADEGVYRFYSRATDLVGNGEPDPQKWFNGSFIVDNTAPVVAWQAPAAGASVTAPVQLIASVSDYTNGQFNVDDFYFEVDGSRVDAQWSASPWTPGQPRQFRAWAPLPSGPHTAMAVAVDRAGNTGSSTATAFSISGQDLADVTAPDLVVDAPADGSWVTSTVAFAGTASDTGSGLASVEISLDGGYSYTSATLSGSNWNWTWAASERQQFVSYPVQIRARDRAGNTTLNSRSITFDNQPPTGLVPVTFSAEEGSHFEQPSELSIHWSPVQDGSGTAYVLAAVDQVGDTIPTQIVAGEGMTATLSDYGNWFIHLSVKDQAGNSFTRHFGPWHIGTNEDLGRQCSLRQQSIIPDGFLDLAASEWRSTENLGTDLRPTLKTEPPNTAQSLYVTWDGQSFYLGWQGSYWTLDGTLWAYLDTASGGSLGTVVPSGRELPIAADYAIEVSSPSEGHLWQYLGDHWALAADSIQFAQGLSGGTEVKMPWDISQITRANLIAFALDENDQPWSVFPTSNLAQGAWTRFYHWSNLCSMVDIREGQPVASNLLVTIDSPQDGQQTWGPGETLEYIVTVENLEIDPVGASQVDLSATPGIGLQSISGAACITCPPGGSTWNVQLPWIGAGVTDTFYLTGRLDADLGSLTAVTTTVQMPMSTFGPVSYSHRVDGIAPTLAIDSLTGYLIGPGVQTITGSADDGSGSGVASVQVRPSGGAWQVASGAHTWQYQVDVGSGPVFSLDAFATDFAGNTSAVSTTQFTVDTFAPVVTLTVPSVLTGTYGVLSGSAADLEPSGSQVGRVEVQIDSDLTPWLPANTYAPDSNHQQAWLYTWSLPPAEDGITHTVRARATDLVGNQSEAAPWQTVYVDNVAPQLTAIQAFTRIFYSDYRLGHITGGAVLTGTVSDGSGVAGVFVDLYAPDGSVSIQPAVVEGASWSFHPQFTLPLEGQYRLRVDAIDLSGNHRTAGPFLLEVTNQNISGLQLVNSSPTLSGQTTYFTATLESGANITYTWDFGDASTPVTTQTSAVTHVYTADGVYTATVQAANSFGQLTASTSVTILAAADLQLAKQVSSSQASLESTLIYTLTVTNAGPANAPQVVITDTLPGGLEYQSANFSSGVCSQVGSGTQIIRCELTSLAAGASSTIELTAMVGMDAPVQFTNHAVVSADLPDPDLTNNAASAQTYLYSSQVVYKNDFSGGVGPEWSTAITETTPGGDPFLGQLNNQAEYLYLTNLPAHRALVVEFDLYIIRSWDGIGTTNEAQRLQFLEKNLPEGKGPDLWSFGLDGGIPLLSTTFSNWIHEDQSYPDQYPGRTSPAYSGAWKVNTLGYEFYGIPMDATYHFHFMIPHSGSQARIDFAALGLQFIEDESWGLDNVRVTVSNLYRIVLPIILRP